MKSVSIIIPTYNLTKGRNTEYFEKLLLSIEKSIEESGIEIESIIIVNDQPDENLTSILNNLKDIELIRKRLKIIDNPVNYGQAKSRNIGATYSKADYLHFIDQDDFISSNFYNMIKGNEEDIIISNIKVFKTDKFIQYLKIPAIYLLKKAKSINSLWMFLISNIAYSPGQYLIRRSVFSEIDEFPDLNNRGTDDYGFFLKLFDNNCSIKFHKDAFFFYRIHSIQSKNTLDMKKSLNEFFSIYSLKKSRFKWLISLKKSDRFRYLRISINRMLFFNSIG